MRVLSLIASATEIVCALGCEGQLVGRSHECDFPLSIKSLPICTEPKFEVAGSSAEIDARVKDLLRDALSVYRVDTERLRALAPDVIVTQSQCDVCAVSLKDVESALCQIGSPPGARIVSLLPNALDDIWQDISRVAAALGVAARGEALIASAQKRMSDISIASAKLPSRPTVACIEWIEPLMAAGNWMPELVEMAGGVNLFGLAGKHSPWMTWAELREKDPDVIVVLPCGFDIARTSSEMSLLEKQPGYSLLAAVRSGQVFVADGNQYFNRPGPRVVESLEIMAEMVHPQHFHFGHEGEGFIRWTSARSS